MHKQLSDNRQQRRALKRGRRIGTMELAEKLRCHPASIPRLIKQKRIPPPDKILNKNSWWDGVIDDLIEAGI